MNGWRGRMPHLAGLLFFLTAAANASPPSGEQLQAWVLQLDADEYVAREVATRELVAAGEAALDELAAAIGSASPEASWRAAEALRQITLAGNETTLGKTVAALHRAGRARKPNLDQLGVALRDKHAELRTSRAAASIRALGGKLSSDEGSVSFFAGGVFTGRLPPLVGAIADAYVSDEAAAEATPSQTLVLDQEWQGGDAGLAALADLPQIATLSIEGANLTDTALEHVAVLPCLLRLKIRGGQFTADALLKFRQSRPATRVFTVSQERQP